jgi:proteasome accessory factor B
VQPPEPTAVARVRVREGSCAGLRRGVRSSGPAEQGWEELEIAYADPSRLAGTVAQYGPDAVVVAPDEVREALVRHLTGVVEGTR